MSETQGRLDEGTTFLGFLIGIIIGGIYTLFHIQRNGQELRQSLFSGDLNPNNSVESSLKAGKVTARERYDAFGSRD